MLLPPNELKETHAGWAGWGAWCRRRSGRCWLSGRRRCRRSQSHPRWTWACCSGHCWLCRAPTALNTLSHTGAGNLALADPNDGSLSFPLLLLFLNWFVDPSQMHLSGDWLLFIFSGSWLVSYSYKELKRHQYVVQAAHLKLVNSPQRQQCNNH